MMVQAPFQKALPHVTGARLVLTDPPYNLGFDYGAVDDAKAPEDYAAMIRDFVNLAHNATADDAHMLVIHYPEHFAEMWETYTRNGWRFHDWISWTYHGHTANPTTKKLCKSHRAVLWLTKGEPTFFLDRIRQPFRNPRDARIKERIKAGEVGAKATNHFHVEQVKNGSVEHRGYSNQIPEALLKPLILATTQPGDLVVDPFSGTGSTARAALSLSRRAWGCDANPEVVQYWRGLDTIQELLI